MSINSISTMMKQTRQCACASYVFWHWKFFILTESTNSRTHKAWSPWFSLTFLYASIILCLLLYCGGHFLSERSKELLAFSPTYHIPRESQAKIKYVLKIKITKKEKRSYRREELESNVIDFGGVFQHRISRKWPDSKKKLKTLH